MMFLKQMHAQFEISCKQKIKLIKYHRKKKMISFFAFFFWS